MWTAYPYAVYLISNNLCAGYFLPRTALERIFMELKGLKINFLGDSITEGCCASTPELGYVSVMKKLYALSEARNYGIGGTRIARQAVPSVEAKFDQDFCMRYVQMDPDADIVIVFGGTNDHGHGDAPFGSHSDRTPDTFWGACHFLFSGLCAQFPRSRIVVLTPLHRAEEGNQRNGKYLEDYVQVIRNVATAYQLPVLDLYETSKIKANIPENARRLTTDGLHPNDEGHQILAEEIGSFLQNL